MKSATFRATILTAGLMISGVAAADGTAVLYPELITPPGSGAIVVPNVGTGGNPGKQVTGNPAGVAGTAAKVGNEARTSRVLSENTLSTLGALALGIIGLLWVRRHTAEL
jgi:hypothetical protein